MCVEQLVLKTDDERNLYQMRVSVARQAPMILRTGQRDIYTLRSASRPMLTIWTHERLKRACSIICPKLQNRCRLLALVHSERTKQFILYTSVRQEYIVSRGDFFDEGG